MANIEKIFNEEIEKVKPFFSKYPFVFFKGSVEYDNLMKDVILSAYRKNLKFIYQFNY